MFSLARQVFALEQGVKEPELLSEDFIFASPYGVLNKKDFISFYRCDAREVVSSYAVNEEARAHNNCVCYNVHSHAIH
jgi:hypothetical protein